MKSYLDDAYEQIQAGIEGKAIWIPIAFPELGKHVGIGKHQYTIIGGESG